MKTFVVFDRSTGEILHTHVEPEGLQTTPEEILQFAVAPARAQACAVLEVSTPELSGKHAYRVKDGALIPDATAPAGSGYVSSGAETLANLPRHYTQQE